MIISLGAINLDLIARVQALPLPGETVLGETLVEAPGGKGANQALAARRAGAQVAMIGAVGDDGFREAALQSLAAGGVDLAQVRRSPLQTGVALIQVDAFGENTVTVLQGANAALSPEEAAAAVAAFQPGSTLMLQQEIPFAVSRRAAQEARKLGMRIVLNAAPYAEAARDLADLADVLVVNAGEFDSLRAPASGPLEEAMSDHVARTGQTLIVTLGAGGAVGAAPGQFVRATAHPVQAVDTVGAGDTFCGYFAEAYDRGMDLEPALRRAVVAASLACTRAGAQPAIPVADEVARAMG